MSFYPIGRPQAAFSMDNESGMIGLAAVREASPVFSRYGCAVMRTEPDGRGGAGYFRFLNGQSASEHVEQPPRRRPESRHRDRRNNHAPIAATMPQTA